MPACTEVGGEPLIVGAVFGGSVTVIVNAGNEALASPSLTEITMFENVPTLPAAGVPESRPVVVLNAHYTGLGIARSLSDLPVTVYGLTAETGTPARSSRRLQIVPSPDTEREPLAAAEFLLHWALKINVADSAVNPTKGNHP